MTGYCENKATGTLTALTRIVPRILTLDGYEALFGNTPPGSPNRLTHIASAT
jgi:hypothetical protein